MTNIQHAAYVTSAQMNTCPSQIGNTPMQSISLTIEGKIRTVHLKLEGENPTGSVKDRTGYALIQDLEERGLLQQGSTVIESTSGNLGVALSFICKWKGYAFVAVVDPKTTPENIAKMQAWGAVIDIVAQPDSNGGYLLSRLERIKEICTTSHTAVWTDQYSNLANPRIHYETTGPEIYRQMNSKVDAVFVAASTGGTLAGIGRFFHEISPATHIIGVDAHGSVIFNTTPAPRMLTGIGSSRSSSFITAAVYDCHMLVSDGEAFSFCHALYKATGLQVGGSSGAVLSACGRYLQAHPEIVNAVCVCADRGDNYSSSIFNQQWLEQHGLHLTPAQLRPVEKIA